MYTLRPGRERSVVIHIYIHKLLYVCVSAVDVNMTEVTTSMVEMGGMVADNASSRASTIAGAAQVIIGRMSVVLLSLPAVLLAAWPSLQIEARRIGRMQ